METLVGGIIHVVPEKHEIDDRKKNNNIQHFLNFLTVGIMMEGSQKLVFQRHHPLQMSGFRLMPWWKKKKWAELGSKRLNTELCR